MRTELSMQMSEALEARVVDITAVAVLPDGEYEAVLEGGALPETNRDGYREYKSNPAICKSCPKRMVCTHSKGFQKVVLKHIWADYIELAEDYRHSPQGAATYARRSQTIVRVFADAKEKHGMRYTLLKGLARVTNWLRLKFATMNLKKMALWA